MPTIRQVVENGICVGCGACAVAGGGKIAMRRNDEGLLVADLSRADEPTLERVSRVCPFAHEADNEDAIARRVFANEPHADSRVGRYRTIHAGRVTSDEYLEDSSSGGFTSWLVLQLLARGLIDGVLHVGRAQGDCFSYVISRTQEELRARRKSAYYATTFAEVMQSIRGDGLRYAFVGVPCFVKSARLVCSSDAVLHGQIRFFAGLVCGHLKSAAFAECLSWQCGVAPDDIEAVDFRVKAPGRDAGRYDFGVRPRGGTQWVTQPTFKLLGGNWGHAMFQPEACNYCDDIFAETADVVFGDAWLPEYRQDSRGTNIVITRNATIDRIFADGVACGEIWLEPLTAERAALSQGGNFRHRRDGLSVRLADDRKAGKWVPLKRVEPGSIAVSRKRKELIRARRQLSAASHSVFLQAKMRASLEFFLMQIKPFVHAYERYNRNGPIKRALLQVRRLVLSR